MSARGFAFLCVCVRKGNKTDKVVHLLTERGGHSGGMKGGGEETHQKKGTENRKEVRENVM